MRCSRHGQGLPLDPPFADEATIGGILATNDSGPLRHRYGAPRDLVLGVQLATTDGVLSKAGGQVVKNVAGYDLSKLVAGSFGSLAAIVSATFKLSPLPEASKTMRVAVADDASLAQAVRTVMASQLEPIAFEVDVRSTIDAESVDRTRRRRRIISADSAASAFNVAPALRVAAGRGRRAGRRRHPRRCRACATSIDVVDGDAERTLWRAHATRLWDGAGRDRARELAAGVDCRRRRASFPQARRLIGRAAIGTGLMRIDGDDAEQARVIGQLRHSPHVGNVVVVRGSAGLKALVDVWGPQGDRQRLLSAMKRAFDPNGVLNAGRGPL